MSVNLVEEQVIGGLASAQDRDALLAWLQAYGTDVCETCEFWIRSYPHQTWVTKPIPEFARFRLASSDCLKNVRHTLESISQQVSPPGFIIWGFENLDNQGLDDFELQAMFAPFVDIEHIRQIDGGAPVSSVVVAGRLREEIVGLAFQITERDLRSRSRLNQGLRLLDESRLPVTTIFIDHASAVAMANEPHGQLTASVLKVLDRCGAAPGLVVPANRTKAALKSLKREADPLRAIAADIAAVDHVCFKTPSVLDSPDTTLEMTQAGLRYDSSVVVRRHRTWRRSRRPYILGAYQPAAFDHLIPCGRWNDARWIECPLIHIGISDSEAFWEWRRNTRWKQLAQLLDFKRMEKYFTEAAKKPSLHRKYHEYRVYNWPRPEPSPRCSLLDCGHIADLAQLEVTLQYAARLVDPVALRTRIVGHRAFFYAVQGEVKRRSAETVPAALRDQVSRHVYLNAVGRDAPLREDIQEFSRFLPQRLGSVLDLGRGTGQLGENLRPRSDVYVAMDAALQSENRARCETLCVADAHVLPFPEQCFDTVIANDTLEYLSDPLHCLKEVCRVLKPGGHLYALVPLDGLNSAYELRAHLWKATRENIARALNIAGLSTDRTKVIDLYRLGINASFPNCKGLVCAIDAIRPAEKS
jgi:SAM-dependent methyltransferase